MRKVVYALARPLVQGYARLTRGVTFGVRVAAFAPDGRVVLVRHTYVPGWHLPGGGVDPGEAAVEAAERELREETHAHAPAEALTLFGVYTNFETMRGDHIALYVARGVAPVAHTPDREIAEVMWARPDALPDGATPATRARLEEIAAGRAPSRTWRTSGAARDPL